MSLAEQREYFCSALLNIHIQEIARGFVLQADKNLTHYFQRTLCSGPLLFMMIWGIKDKIKPHDLRSLHW